MRRTASCQHLLETETNETMLGFERDSKDGFELSVYVPPNSTFRNTLPASEVSRLDGAFVKNTYDQVSVTGNVLKYSFTRKNDGKSVSEEILYTNTNTRYKVSSSDPHLQTFIDLDKIRHQWPGMREMKCLDAPTQQEPQSVQRAQSSGSPNTNFGDASQRDSSSNLQEPDFTSPAQVYDAIQGIRESCLAKGDNRCAILCKSYSDTLQKINADVTGDPFIHPNARDPQQAGTYKGFYQGCRSSMQ
jgi:hypothetical protein